jgi:hypothetical protein
MVQGKEMKKQLDNKKGREKGGRTMIERFSTRDMLPNPRGVK